MKPKMAASKLYLLPLSVFIIMPLTFAATYFIALAKDHILPFFSYISDTGTLPPEMNVFAQMLNIAGVLIGCTAYVRFKQIQHYFKSRSKPGFEKYNKLGLVFGIIAGLGSSVVGNMQESNVIVAHIVGAWMAFGGGSIFLIIQAYFTFQMLPLFATMAVAFLRMAIGIVCFVLFLTSFVTGAMSTKQFTGDKMLKWTPSDGGWTLRVTSVVTEWVMAALLNLFFLTLVPEFKKINMQGPKFSFVQHVGGATGQKVVMQRVGTDDV